MDIDFNNLMKQAQEMQKRMQDVQREIASLEVKGLAGAGLVEVVLTGRYECKRVKIDAGLLSESKEVLEDLIAAAINDAVHKVDEGTRGKMASLTAGLDLPKDFQLPEGNG
jgi:DNA-binding YbaB/EbfC family protein